MMPPKPRQSKGTCKGNRKEGHMLRSCDMGTLFYRADIPLNERRGARVESGPHCYQW